MVSKREINRRRNSFAITAIGDKKKAKWLENASDDDINAEWERGLKEIQERKEKNEKIKMERR